MKNFFKKIIDQTGFQIHRLQPSSDTMMQVIMAIRKVKTNLVFDISANTGQFSSEIRRKGYKGKIVSFEPLESA